MKTSSYEALESAKESAAPYYQTAKEATFKVYNFAQQEVADFAENVKDGYNSLQEKCAEYDACKSTQQAAAYLANEVSGFASATSEKVSGFSKVVVEKVQQMGSTF